MPMIIKIKPMTFVNETASSSNKKLKNIRLIKLIEANTG
jgi:hypothetical protein